MSIKLNLVAVLAMGGLLAACSTAEVAKMPVKGGAYEKGLHSGYIQLADMEYSEDDWPDGDIFVDRARLAAMGNPSAPEPLSARKLISKHSKPLGAARTRLVAALDGGAVKSMGDLAAKAQVSFECWMQEAEENMQPKHIAACRNDFYGYMARLEAGAPAPMMADPAPADPRKQDFIVYFDLDGEKVSEEGATIVKAAAGFAKRNKATNLYVTGHTDRSGSREYNTKLAKSRTDAVIAALTSMKVKKSAIGSVVYGEDNLAVSTADGKTEGRNRRVVISVIY